MLARCWDVEMFFFNLLLLLQNLVIWYTVCFACKFMMIGVVDEICLGLMVILNAK